MASPVTNTQVPIVPPETPKYLPGYQVLTSPRSILKTKVDSQYQDDIQKLFFELSEKGLVERTKLPNSCARPTFVIAQGCMEFYLLEKLKHSPDNVICVIHTDTPTTPLCTDDDIGFDSLISAQAKEDQGTRLSVKMRIPIIHEFCKVCSESNPFHVIYRQSRQSAAENKNYIEDRKGIEAVEAAKLQDQLFSQNLNSSEYHINSETNMQITPELSGASYLYLENGEWRIFSVHAQQAKDANDSSDWKIWDVGICSGKGKALFQTYNRVWPKSICEHFKI